MEGHDSCEATQKEEAAQFFDWLLLMNRSKKVTASTIIWL